MQQCQEKPRLADRLSYGDKQALTHNEMICKLVVLADSKSELDYKQARHAHNPTSRAAIKCNPLREYVRSRRDGADNTLP